MNDLQKGILNIWIEFDRVCKKLDIPYIAMGGTLLGAIRHQGFIPWDDDMDVGMLRKDYERFLKEAPKEFDSRYFVQDHSTDPDYYFPFIKIRDNETTAIEWVTQKGKFNQGLWLDIFPFDALPEKEVSVKDTKKFKKLVNRIAAHYNPPAKSTLRKILKPFKHFLLFLRYPSLEKVYRELNDIISRYNDKGFDEGLFAWIPDKVSMRFPMSIFDKLTTADFEGHKIPVSVDAVKMLEIQYGDWEKLPPENQRYTHPMYKLDLNKSYKNYLK